MKLKPLLAILIPLMVMAGWISIQAYHSQKSSWVQLKVTGYDPRDLLSGHYLRYEVVYGPRGKCKDFKSQTKYCQCLEITDSDNMAKSYWLGSCYERPKNCYLYLKGQCQHGRFTAGIERYYFPEEFKKLLKTLSS